MILDDCLLCIVLQLPAIVIIKIRLVNKHFSEICDFIDWKELFIQRVKYEPDVSSQFDWRSSLVMLETKSAEIHACCTWNHKSVRLMSPWNDHNTTCIYDSAVIIGSLKKGVLRDLTTIESTQGISINFIYDRAFVLKGIRYTCIRRKETNPCNGCQQKKRCLNQKYKYYIHKLNHPNVNDLLCSRILGFL